jgi:riboflavin kinase / FMN adenylyltransferase
MLIFRGISPKTQSPSRRAVSIGNFDGVHRGHQALIDRVKAAAQAHQLRSAIVTFEPHPKAFFNPQNAPGRIQCLRDKAAALAGLGIDELWILPFRQSLAQMSAEDFMQRFLKDTLQCAVIVTGDDFCFGAKRRGNFELLEAAGAQHQWRAERVHTVLVNNDRASSSTLIQALQGGDIAKASDLMGRAYTLSGHVIHGKKLGRDLGFPTLNIPVPKSLVLSGIFVVSVHGLAATPLPAVASLGRRPTVEHAGQLLLEVHCLDWSGNGYGRVVSVEFHQKLRDEAHYTDLAVMTQQIQQDAQDARDYFAHYVH